MFYSKGKLIRKWLRKIYELIPFKAYFYRVLRKLIKLPATWHEYFYFKGVFSTNIGSKKFVMMNYGFRYHVENKLFWGGVHNGWERVSMDLWMKWVDGAEVILDVGANTGCYSLIAKTLNSEAKVYAFEPMKGIFDKLKRNCKLNNYEIDCNQLALSNYTGKAIIYPTSLDHVYSVTVNKNMFADEKVYEEEIYTIRLDEFIERKGIIKIDLMKIDVETHEVEVLEGMGRYLELFKPDMLIEIQSDEIGFKIGQLIKNIDYVFFSIDEDLGFKKVDVLKKANGLNYLICKRKKAISNGLIS